MGRKQKLKAQRRAFNFFIQSLVANTATQGLSNQEKYLDYLKKITREWTDAKKRGQDMRYIFVTDRPQVLMLAVNPLTAKTTVFDSAWVRITKLPENEMFCLDATLVKPVDAAIAQFIFIKPKPTELSEKWV